MKKIVRIGLETSSLMPLVVVSPFSSSVYNRIWLENGVDNCEFVTASDCITESIDVMLRYIKYPLKKIEQMRDESQPQNKIYAAFNNLFKKFQDATIVVSYRSDCIPPITDLKRILRNYKPVVREERYSGYKYVLSNNNSEECLLLGLDGKS